MSVVFEKTTINGMELPNRLVRSATHEGMADENGFPGSSMFKLYERLAKGGVGLLNTGYAYVAKDGLCPFHRQTAMDRDELIPRWRELVDLVHQYETKIAAQIAHSGRQTFEAVTGTQPIAPSAVHDSVCDVMPREMTEDDIERVIENFAQATRRVKEAGFDAVQFHGAHGYLLNNFMCPHTNRRTDKWGGSTENRVRILGQIIDRCRRLVGNDFPIMIKYSGWDKMENGISPEEGVRIGQKLAEMGYDAIEVSAGLVEDNGSTFFGKAPFGTRPEQAFNRHVAKALKSSIDKPVMLCGGITDPTVIEDVIQSGDADYITMCRALISDPGLPAKIMEGNTQPARCIQCNLCMGYIVTQPVNCYQGKPLKEEPPMFDDWLVLDQ